MSSEQVDIALGTRWKHCLARTFPYRVFRLMECVAYGYPNEYMGWWLQLPKRYVKAMQNETRVLRRCGLTLGFAPRMSSITEDDVLLVKPGFTCDSTANGTWKKILFWDENKLTLEPVLKKYSEKMCHPSHDDEQHQQRATLQRQDQQQGSNTEQRQIYMSGTYKYLVVHFTAVYSTSKIYQVQVPCCENTPDT